MFFSKCNQLFKQFGCWQLACWHLRIIYPHQFYITQLLFLQRIKSSEERKVIVKQLGEFLPRGNLDMEVLLGIVDLTLSTPDDDEERLGRDTATPTQSDIRKMKSVLWLCFNEHHRGEALIAANKLLRQFFLAGHKIASASMFVEEILND